MKRILVIIAILLTFNALFAKGRIYGWGTGIIPATSHHVLKGVNLDPYDDYIDVSAANGFALGLRENGSISAWGNKAVIINNKPAGTGFTAISAGNDRGVAIDSDGNVIQWGLEGNETPNYLSTGGGFIDVSAGDNFVIALHSDGSVHGWVIDIDTPIDLSAYTGVYTQISSGSFYAYFLSNTGEIAYWDGSEDMIGDAPAGNDFVQIAAGNSNGVALRADGSAVAWGYTGSATPAPNQDFVYVCAGNGGSVGIKYNGALVAWGRTLNLSTIPVGLRLVGFGKADAGNDYYLAVEEFIDHDDDGVADLLDAFPNDPERAYIVQYPADSEGTLAFEDLWPAKGDYDFNDFVVGYRLTQVLDSQLRLKDLSGDFSLRAVGGTSANSFAVEFPIDISNIEGQAELTIDGNTSHKELIPAGDNSILKIIENTASMVNILNADNLWNTQPDKPYNDPIPFSFSLTVNNAVAQGDLPGCGFWNPFLMIQRNAGRELHLPGYPPTIHADESFFKTGDDDTDLVAKKYYKTENNLPWAIDVPAQWKYPVEHAQITKAYMRFADWAQSGGEVHTDWYETTSDGAVQKFIYNP